MVYLVRDDDLIILQGDITTPGRPVERLPLVGVHPTDGQGQIEA